VGKYQVVVESEARFKMFLKVSDYGSSECTYGRTFEPEFDENQVRWGGLSIWEKPQRAY